MRTGAMGAGPGWARSPLIVLGIVLGVASTANARPWTVRERSTEPVPAHQLRNPATWPAEPTAPTPLDVMKFQAAYAHLCSTDASSPTAAMAVKIAAAAAAANGDPFTIAALAYYGSKCDPAFHAKGAYGLLAIDPAMYRVPDAPAVPVAKDDLSAARLMDPATNLAVGVSLLQMWEAEHREIDESFGGAPHRNAVSHFIWGDEVRSSGHEDLILVARRRLIETYNGVVETPRPSPYGVSIVCPLEAPPRVATSGPGDEREGGARQHKGLDITGTIGEPVRSLADGTVIFAGVNMPGHARKGPIPPEKVARYRNRRLGVGGIYLCIEHEADRKVVSCYMHLNSYVVAERDHVSAGQTIGYLGRTGVKVSPPHLHFEVRVNDRTTNPVKTLGNYVIPPKATQTHQYVLRARRAKAKLRA